MRGSAEAGTAALAGARILVVEDDFLVLLEIATVLSDAGATVLKCATVEQALQTIATDPFAAALLDVRLGRRNSQSWAGRSPSIPARSRTRRPSRNGQAPASSRSRRRQSYWSAQSPNCWGSHKPHRPFNMR